MYPFLNAIIAKTITFLATAYCLTGITTSGHYTGPGTIAVYPRQVPLGTRLYVPGYGWGVARDTGSAIGWGRLDLWYPSCSRALSWGARSVRVRVYF